MSVNQPMSEVEVEYTPNDVQFNASDFAGIYGSLPTPRSPTTTIEETDAPTEQFVIPRDETTDRLPHGHGGQTRWQWRTRAMFKEASKFLAYIDAQPARKQRISHSVVSPHPEKTAIDSTEQFTNWTQKSAAIAEHCGYEGGMVFPHAFTVANEVRAEFAELAGSTDDLTATSGHLWTWVLYQDNPREYLDWNPHFHVVGNIDGGNRETYLQEEGVLVKHIQDWRPHNSASDYKTASDAADHAGRTRNLFRDLFDHLTISESTPSESRAMFGDYPTEPDAFDDKAVSVQNHLLGAGL